MSRSRGWLLIVVVAVLAAVAVRLGVWQLDRLGTRRDGNARLLDARAQPPIDLDTSAPAPGRRAIARGRFEPSGQLLLRSRVHRAAPGLHVVSPFRVEATGTVLWVLRGFVPAADGVRADSIPGPDPRVVTIHGELHPLPTTDNAGQPVASNGDTTWRRFDEGVARHRRPEAVPLLLYLEDSATGVGRLAPVEPPTLDNGPHLSYALQWFAIAIAIMGFGVYALRKPSGRERAPPAAAP